MLFFISAFRVHAQDEDGAKTPFTLGVYQPFDKELDQFGVSLSMEGFKQPVFKAGIFRSFLKKFKGTNIPYFFSPHVHYLFMREKGVHGLESGYYCGIYMFGVGFRGKVLFKDRKTQWLFGPTIGIGFGSYIFFSYAFDVRLNSAIADYGGQHTLNLSIRIPVLTRADHNKK